MTKSIAMYYAFARSGGTLVNQLLACSPDVIVLSEVSPVKSVVPIEHQLCEWHRLLAPGECTAFARLAYTEKLTQAHALAVAAGKHLCVRDWVSLNFLPDIDEDGDPSGCLENPAYLRDGGFEVRHCAVLRRAQDIYDSLARHIPSCRALSAEAFAFCYRKYLQAIVRGGITRFYLEDIQRNPEILTDRICRALSLPSPPSITGFYNNQNCTGNNSLVAQPDSALEKHILPSIVHDSPSALFSELDVLAGYAD